MIRQVHQMVEREDGSQVINNRSLSPVPSGGCRFYLRESV